MRFASIACAAAVSLASAAAPAAADAGKSLRLGIVTFLSGPGAGPMGIPSRNAAELLVDALNAGTVPAPYQTKGFGGRSVDMVLTDEAGSTSNVVTQYRALVQQRGAEIVVGYISSGSCLAVAPLAEEMHVPTVFFNCGTARLFEEASYKYAFRTASHATMDNVAAARYVKERFPGARKIGGINQNYAWGQDSWREFEGAMKVLVPGAETVSAQMPKLFASQYASEISTLSEARPDVIQSSFWGGDLEAFILQATPRSLFAGRPVLFTCGETQIHRVPAVLSDGTVIGARGPHSVFAPDTPLNRWFASAYQARYGAAPTFTAYHMAQAIFGIKSAYEKAKGAAGDKEPDAAQISTSFEGLSFETPSGTTKMALGQGHQGIQGTAYGTVKLVNGKVTLVNVSRYSAEEVNPPPGVKSEDWIRSGLGRK